MQEDIIKRIRESFGILGNELVQRQNKSYEDLATCNGVAEADDKENTCVLCVAVNHTVYRNGNRCNYHHKNCKCGYRFFNGKLQVNFDKRKITNYLFMDKNKTAAMRSMGYYPEDSQEVYDYLHQLILRAYDDGDYSLNYLNINGQHAQIDFVLKGKRDHIGELFACHAGCVFWPYGRIKVSSPLIKDYKI